MAEKEGTIRREEFTGLDELEIEPLVDNALEAVAGGGEAGTFCCCSCITCSDGPSETELQ